MLNERCCHAGKRTCSVGSPNHLTRFSHEKLSSGGGGCLSLRHFEQLTRAEAARVLGIEESAAAKCYIRALKRLKDTLADMPGGLEGL